LTPKCSTASQETIVICGTRPFSIMFAVSSFRSSSVRWSFTARDFVSHTLFKQIPRKFGDRVHRS